MKSLFYLYIRTLINRFKIALRKPAAYFSLLLLIWYVVMFANNGKELLEYIGLDSPQGLVVVLTVIIFFTVPLNFYSYSKRKGIVFDTADVNFIFTAPLNPKLAILYTQLKSYVMLLILNIAVGILSVFLMHVSIWSILLYILVAIPMGKVMEGSMATILYCNETLTVKVIKGIGVLLQLILAALVMYAGYLFIYVERSPAVVTLFLNSDILQCIPVIGWNIALLRLIILGPDIINLICSLLYLITLVFLLYYAVCMKCTGEYFEDALSFAEGFKKRKDAVLKQKESGIVVSLKKRKLRKAVVEYKGSGAKAIFYKQLLEYKKERFFIFNFYTLFYTVIGIVVCIVLLNTEPVSGVWVNLILPLVSLYTTIIFSSVAGRWKSELEMHYTFLIPDTPIRKLWYTTLFQNIKSLIEGALLVIPASFFLGLSPFVVILTILVHLCMQMNKLYINILCDALLGEVLVAMLKTLVCLIIQLTVLGIAAAISAVGFFLGGIEACFILFCIILLLGTLLIAWGSSRSFVRLEIIGE